MAAVPFGDTTLFLSTKLAGTLKAYYRAENLLDYSGNGKTLVKTATVSHSAAKFKNGFDATWDDATGGNHLINTSVYQPSTGDFTLACWFKKNGGPSADFTPSLLMLGQQGGDTSCQIWIKKTSGYMSGIVTNSGSNTAESTTNVCDNAFHFLVYTRIGTTLTVYVDGSSVATGSSSKSINGAELHIGFNGLNSGFDDIGAAIVDDVFVLSRGLTSQEVTDLNSGALLAGRGLGGIMSQTGLYTIHTFLADETFTALESLDVEYLLVGGGAAGGGHNGAGGGGGGEVKPGTATLTAGDYAVVIGAGGTGVAGNRGNDGASSTWNSLTAIGGGGGASNLVSPGNNGKNGASGGGALGAGTPGTGSAGNNGGSGSTDAVTYSSGGGGGGANAVGGNASALSGGLGGDGVASSISGSSVTYGGGGGGSHNGNIGTPTGGAGGGGKGQGLTDAVAGTANTGGGGGGETGDGTTPGKAGGSGIFIVRYFTVAPKGGGAWFMA